MLEIDSCKRESIKIGIYSLKLVVQDVVHLDIHHNEGSAVRVLDVDQAVTDRSRQAVCYIFWGVELSHLSLDQHAQHNLDICTVIPSTSTSSLSRNILSSVNMAQVHEIINLHHLIDIQNSHRRALIVIDS